MLTITQRERLIDLIKEARGWDAQGIRDALIKTEEQHHPSRFATWLRVVGAYVDAEDDHGRPRYKTPALLAEPGPHWSNTPTASRPQPKMCAEHPAEHLGRCAQCDALATPPPPGWRDQVPKATNPPDRRNPVQAARLTPDQLAAAEAAADPEGDQP